MGHVHTDQCDTVTPNCNKNHEHNDNCWKVVRNCGQLTDYEIEQQNR